MVQDKKKRGLGRGLEALLTDVDGFKNPAANLYDVEKASPAQDTLTQFVVLDLDQITVNPYNPRQDFNEDALQELAASIRIHGVIQPITVRKKTTGEYELVSGERRFRASQLAEQRQIPAYILHDKRTQGSSMLEIALIENIQREDLNPLEIALSYERLMHEFDFSQEQLADRLSKKRSTIANYLRLLRLSPEIQAGLRDDQISMGHAKALLALEENPNRQLAIFALILEEQLSVRKTEELVREQPAQDGEMDSQKVKDSAEKKPATIALQEEELQEIKEKLSLILDTEKINLVMNKNGSGKIVMNFSSIDQIQRMINNLGL